MLFHPAAVAHAWDETSALRGLRLVVPAEVRAGWRRPGQYLRLRTDGAEGSFAIASPPGGEVEVLVKRGARAADALAALTEGAAVEASVAQGRGFPVDESVGRDLLLVAAGSGITPMRAVIHHLLGARERFGKVILFYGHRRPDDFAYTREWPDWRAAQIDIVPVVSDGAASYDGEMGWVQDALLRRRPDGARASAFLAGMPAMVGAVSATLGDLGVPADRIHLNY